MRLIAILLLLLISTPRADAVWCDEHKSASAPSRRMVEGRWCYYDGRFDEVKPVWKKYLPPVQPDPPPEVVDSFEDRWNGEEGEGIRAITPRSSDQ